MTTVPSTSPAFRHRGALLLLAALALAGCATAKPPPDISWPRPPDKARIRWVRAFQSEDDLKKSAMRDVFKTLVPTSGEAVVGQPTGLALSVDEKTLYVACAPLHRVLAVDLAAGKIRKFADAGDNRPSAPFALAVDANDNVYVSDSRADTVLVYARDGKFLRKLGGDKLERPTGLAIDRRRQLVYVVSGVTQPSTHHRVEVFSLAGAHLRTVGTRGAAPGEFNFPTNLAVSKDGTLHVVDMLNFRVQAFDPEGQLVGAFGRPGAAAGAFDKAKAIAFDSFGNIYVTDSEQGSVQMFNAQHKVLMAFAGRSESPGHLRLPTAIVIDSKNTIYVADYWTHVVNEYQLVNTAAEDSFKAAEPEAPRGSGGAPSGQKPQGG